MASRAYPLARSAGMSVMDLLDRQLRREDLARRKARKERDADRGTRLYRGQVLVTLDVEAEDSGMAATKVRCEAYFLRKKAKTAKVVKVWRV